MRKIIFLLFMAPLLFTQACLAKDKLEIIISSPEKSFSVGEGIPVTVVYKNISEEGVRILGLREWAHPLSFDVLDSKGKHSVVIRAPRPGYNVDYKKDFIELPKGGSLKRSYDLNEFFRFVKPDKYAVTAIYSSFWGLPETRSNTIHINITEKAK